MSEVALLRQIAELERRLARLENHTSPLISLPMHAFAGTFPMPFTITQTPFAVPLPSGRAVRLQLWTCPTFVVAPNDGTNYWTVGLINIAATVQASFSTIADTAATWTPHAVLANSFATIPVPTSAVRLAIVVTKTGAPGGLYITNLLLARLAA